MATLADFGSVKRDDGFFRTSAFVMAFVIIAGFSLQFAAGRSSFAAPPLVHAHALVFMGWVAIYLSQSVLATSGGLRLHRKLGWVAAAWMVPMLILGCAVTVALVQGARVPFFFTPLQFIALDIFSLFAFVGLMVAGIANRRRTDWHRRLNFCAMTLLLGPGIGRLLPMPLLIPYAFEATVLAVILFPIAGMIADVRRSGKIHPAWQWGMAVILGHAAVTEIFTHTDIGLPLYNAIAAGDARRRGFATRIAAIALGSLERKASRVHLIFHGWKERHGWMLGVEIGGSLKGVDLREEIDRLRKERNAVILAHYYQKPEIQDLADFVGDSLDLSRKAAATDADVIAFCGVKFMADTAKILSPDKIVVLPDLDAGCSLEDSCPPEKFAAFRAEHPDHIALTYINCSTEVKALSDIIVTSSSADKILSQIPRDQKIIFGPDKHLGGYLARKTGRDMLLWPGVCIVHEAFSETELVKLKAHHPGAPVAAHPECPAHILDHADYVGSTSGILAFAKDFPGDTLIVATEPHIMHQMEKALPDKHFIGAPGADGNCNCNICPYMALNTMEKLYVALRDLQPRIEIEEGLRLRAKKSLDRMLEMAGSTVGQGDLGAR